MMHVILDAYASLCTTLVAPRVESISLLQDPRFSDEKIVYLNISEEPFLVEMMHRNNDLVRIDAFNTSPILSSDTCTCRVKEASR